MENPFKPAEKINSKVLVITLLFAFIGIAVMAAVNQYVANPYLLASFGSTAVLIYAAPKAPFSKPKNVFFGHVFSAIVAITLCIVFDAVDILDDLNWMACGLCVMFAILVMILTGTVHPPAGATALTIPITYICDYMFVVRPIAIGILVMMGIAYLANQLRSKVE